jgi:uncharacterized protein
MEDTATRPERGEGMKYRRKLVELDRIVRDLYRTHASAVPYHGWHHIDFVVKKASVFLVELQADELLTVAAAYVHDFNYLVAGHSVESQGKDLRAKVLGRVSFDRDVIERIESIVAEARTSHRHAGISREAMALSDADAAYKALPIAPLMTVHYMSETGRTLRELAQKIVSEQTALSSQGIYFYSSRARADYGKWAEDNLRLWTRVLESMDSEDVTAVLAEIHTEPGY